MRLEEIQPSNAAEQRVKRMKASAKAAKDRARQLLNMSGEVVGVVVAKADAIRIAKVTGDILQNVNFAISVGTLRGFLEANRVDYSGPSIVAFAKKPDTLADEARKFTVKVECWR